MRFIDTEKNKPVMWDDEKTPENRGGRVNMHCSCYECINNDNDGYCSAPNCVEIDEEGKCESYEPGYSTKTNAQI